MACLIASATFWYSAAAEMTAENGVPPGRFALMTRGINVGWLNNKQCQLNRERAEQELAVIKSADCRHVRLYLNIDSLRNPAAREKPSAHGLGELDATIDLLLQNGLAVIIDPFHYGAEGLLKFPRPNDPEVQVMVDFWAPLARHFAKQDPERVFFEVANEPGLDDPLEWYAVEARILARMRKGARGTPWWPGTTCGRATTIGMASRP